MQKGFKKVVLGLIQAKPGLTPQEYAEMALNQHLCSSDSKNPVFSLATTLMKEVREGRMPEVRAEKVNGRLRYFPANYTGIGPVIEPKKDVAISVILPPRVSEMVDTLVKVGRFNNSSEALIWLADEGIRAKNHELDQVKRVVQQIETLKQTVSL